MSMFFGMTGRLRSTGFLLLLALLVVTPARAQDESCELPLTVPDASDVDLILQPNSRGPGILLTWPEPDPEASTCTALTDTAGLGIDVVESGFFTDEFDRTITFTFNGPGTVGSDAADRFVCAWNNANQTRTGRIGGEINLSNTGGLWGRDGGGGWAQRNDGLPPFLPYTNLVDMDAASDGNMLAVLSRGAQVQNDPQGLYRIAASGEWSEVAPAEFGRQRSIAFVAVRPSSSERFAVGSRTEGLFVTTDSGATFDQWTGNLDPDYDSIPGSFDVTAVTWTDARLMVSVRNFGTFVSTDNGGSFSRFDDLGEAFVRTLEQGESSSDRILAGITGDGVHESVDGGQTWTALNGNIPGSAVPTVLAIDLDPADADAIVIGTLNQGIWYTSDRGANWFAAVTPFDDDDAFPIKPEVWDFLQIGGELLGLADGFGVLETADAGQTWTEVAGQPSNRNGRRLVATAAGLQRPTTGGGIYVPGTPISITASQTSAKTDPQFAGLEFGVSIEFGPGDVALDDVDDDGIPEPRSFFLVCQVYQGWIVWKSESNDPDNMTMAGRFDKSNPESCIEGFCGDDSFVQLPNCFSERRAACFVFNDDATVSFFDGSVYNGFTYYYSVTPFDYGDVSLVTDPISLVSPMVYPARFAGDPVAPGPGNRQSFQVNNDAAAELDGEEIYVFPNPLRRGSGIAGSEGEEVIWTNLPPQSQIQVYTLAGDRVADLPKESGPQDGGNIYWITRNDDNQLLAAGVYMWRVLMPDRGDFWGKLVIIR